MKKLLALILCVMMFVAVIPTSAFAEPIKPTNAWPTIDNPLESVAKYQKNIDSILSETKKNIQAAYGTLVGDKVVYTTAKSMDDTIVNLVDAISKDLVAKNKAYTINGEIDVVINKAYIDGVKDQVRLLIDEMVADKMIKNADKYVTERNDDGSVKKIDPIKYAQTFNKAVSDALTDKKFMKGYEAVATLFGMMKLTDDINEKLKDEYDAFKETIDSKFDTKFPDRYPLLDALYVDTMGEAAVGAVDDPWSAFPYAKVSMS